MSLGEALTRSETIKDDAQGFNENAKTAKRGGAIAGKARLTVEKETGKKVVSPLNTKNILSIENRKKNNKSDESV